MRRIGFFVGLGCALLAISFELGWIDRASKSRATDAPVTTEAPGTAAPSPATRPAPTPSAPARPSSSAPARPSTPAVTTPKPEPAPVAPTTATLRIDSDVPGAQVFIDNKFIGTTPATAENVQPGHRKVNVQAPGYEGVAEFVDVSAGPKDVMISLKTIRLDQRVSVEHKHRMGSCTGTLIATPDGVRYQTSHAEDAFSVSLQNIETFTADFLQKNLKLKVRGGKTYEFTDPSGKAEAIYLFHQEVDKVRQRVK
jgi:hypothetical protein